MKTYRIRLSEKITVIVNVKKPLLGKHPKVSSDLFYNATKFDSKEERVCFGLIYEKYQDYDALLEAMVLLGNSFMKYDFLFAEFPYIKEYDYSFVYKHYKEATFPSGSIFEVKNLIIDRRAEVYYLLNNSESGFGVASFEQLRKFPEIIEKYSRTISSNEIGVGFLSNQILGKKFRC